MQLVDLKVGQAFTYRTRPNEVYVKTSDFYMKGTNVIERSYAKCILRQIHGVWYGVDRESENWNPYADIEPVVISVSREKVDG